MKIKYSYILGLIVLSLTFVGIGVSCQKSPINGWLDGQWEVREIQASDGQIIEPEIIINQRLYYNFYMHVCQLTYYGGYFMDGNMQYEDDTLWIEFPYANTEKSLQILMQYGIESNPVIFNVKFEGKKTLILSNEETKVTLIKI